MTYDGFHLSFKARRDFLSERVANPFGRRGDSRERTEDATAQCRETDIDKTRTYGDRNTDRDRRVEDHSPAARRSRHNWRAARHTYHTRACTPRCWIDGRWALASGTSRVLRLAKCRKFIVGRRACA